MVVGRFQIHVCIPSCVMSSEFTHKLVMTNLYQLCFLAFDVNVFKEILSTTTFFNLIEYREVNNFTTHYASNNADLNLILVAATTNRFIFQIINSLTESMGVCLIWRDCKSPSIDIIVRRMHCFIMQLCIDLYKIELRSSATVKFIEAVIKMLHVFAALQQNFIL